MSNTYFVKYLPREGRPEEKNMCKHTLTGFIGRLEYWDSQKMGKRDEGYYLVSNTEFQGVSKTYLEKVEPFLCSKDVKVGDKVLCNGHEDEVLQYPYTDPYGDGYDILLKEEGTQVLGYDVFKVIGKISSEACVKDGDVLTEDQVMFMLINIIHAGINGTLERLRQIYPAFTYKDIRVKIRCPWGHYH
jgi:hypothetical protein